MATRETRLDRGRRQGQSVAARLLEEIRVARTGANLSIRAMARALGWSHARYGRFENDRQGTATIGELAAAGALLGLKLAADFYPVEDAIRDSGQQPLRRRLLALIHSKFKVVSEALLPNPGDRRSWDMLLRLDAQRVGAELETRVRDVQRLVRHTRERERDGGADHVLLVLSASAHNRRVLPELLEALGPGFATPPRVILRALREGQPVPGSGVILL